MVKKKNKKTNSLIRKGIALVASVVTLIFLFLEMISFKTKYINVIKNKTEVESEGIKFSEFLFNEKYEAVRETYSTATTVMWIVFILVIVSVALTALAMFAKKGAMISKIGSISLVVSMLLMFFINFDKVEIVTNVTFWFSNITVLYFVALVLSVVGVASVVKLKD